MSISQIFTDNFNKEQIFFNEPMKNHTSFKVGGPAKIFIKPESPEDIIKAIKLSRENNVKYFIMGNGSNLLFSDNGYNGVIINISDRFNKIEIKDNYIEAYSGALLSSIASRACENSLAGFEFASGIPGSLGGAVYMNAGAYGGEMKDVIKTVKLLDSDLNIIEKTNDEMDFSYRHSIVGEEDLIVLSSIIKLEKGNKEEIKAKIKDLNGRRRDKQPLELPSGGSTFKRPEGHYAGKLIMDSGLKGYTIGGAQISEKHCGFIVNIGNASCKNILDLIEYTKETVYEKYGVILEPEIKIVGD